MPYPDEVEAYTALRKSYYAFCLPKEWSARCIEFTKVGFMLPDIVKKMPWTEKFVVDHDQQTVTIKYADGSNVESDALKEQLQRAREHDSFLVLRGWRNELYQVFGLNRDVRMERSGSALFGIHTIGVHMIGFTKSKDKKLKFWVPRRAKTKQTYGGMLDNTVAGGMSAGEQPFESIIREAGEEASLPEDFVRANINQCGTISYFFIRDKQAAGEVGLLQPETQYVYDIELPEGMAPKPSDDEVEEFYLWDLDTVKEALAKGDFKPNCAVCLIDFMIRHGLITAESEPDYLEIMNKLHRRIRFV